MARGTSSRSRNVSPTPRSGRSATAASQGKGSGGRRRRRDIEDEEDEDVEMEDIDEASQDGHDSIDSYACSLVRLALFAERSRGSFKRDDINKKVLGGNGRVFNSVFARAQEILRKTFGMEIHELMTRVERDKALAPENNTVNATSGKAAKVTSSSKTYILRNTLPSALIEAMMFHDPETRNAAYGARDPDDDAKADDMRPDDTLVAWKLGDNVAAIGILHVILALILANGRSIPEPQLRAQLKKLRLKPGVQIPQLAHSAHQKPLTLDTLLSLFLKSGYLDRQRVSGDGPGKTARKRAADDGEGSTGEDYEWKWGARAIGEINEMGVALMVQDFMGDRFHEREVELEGGDARAGDGHEKNDTRLKHEKAVMNDLVRSAGGPLMKMKEKRRDGSEEAAEGD